MRSSVLSDDAVIEMVNSHFIPVAINVTRDGFPEEAIPALRHMKAAYTSNWRYAFGFAGCLVVDCDGQYPLAHSGSTSSKLESVGFYYRTQVYIEFLISALEKHNKVQEIKAKFRQFDIMGGIAGLKELLLQFQQEIAEHTQSLIRHQEMLKNTGMETIALELEKQGK